MPNLYASPEEIKIAMPDGIRQATTKYDALLLGLAERVSRFIDRSCKRVFFPSYGARVFSGRRAKPRRGTPEDELWVDDLLEIEAIEVSSDNGASYTALAASDYIGTVAGDFNDSRSWTLLALDANGSRSTWPVGQRAVKITGWWGYADQRSEAWEDSGVSLAADFASGALALEVANGAAIDRWGMATALHAGRLVRVEDEALEVTGVTINAEGNDAVAVIGARNGTAAADHATGEGIVLWRPPEPVKQAAIIQAIRQMERGFQGFGDARATPDIGQVMYLKALDPEAVSLLKPYTRLGIG